jgi:CysZ protein
LKGGLLKAVVHQTKHRQANAFTLIRGARYPWQAVGLILGTPSLQSYVLVPILINILIGMTVYVGLLIGSFQAITAFLNQISDWIPDITLALPVGLGWLEYGLTGLGGGIVLLLNGILQIVLVTVVLLVTGFIFLQLGVLLGSPWYSKLSEEVEKNQKWESYRLKRGKVCFRIFSMPLLMKSKKS